MLWFSNYGFRGSTGHSFSIILSVSHFKPGLRYVGDMSKIFQNTITTTCWGSQALLGDRFETYSDDDFWFIYLNIHPPSDDPQATTL